MSLNYLEKNKDITNLSNFKTPSRSKYYFEIHRKDNILKLSEIIKYAKDNNLEVLFIGGGTNLLFAFDLFDGIIIKNYLNGWDYNKKNKILESYSNELISDIAESLYNSGQTIWKRFIGLPGSVGGAILGNAGCFGLEAENNFLDVEVLDLTSGEIITLNKKEMNFKYRSSILKENKTFFIIKVRFNLSEIVEKYPSDTDNIYFRKYKQPKGNTCGSFFKNPSKENSAGSLIERVGLKGKKIGGAYFSELHANFIMSDGTASYKDILKLIEIAQKKVKMDFDISLEPEVRLINN